YGGKPRAIVLGPVAHPSVRWNQCAQFVSHLGRALHVVDAQAHSTGPAVAKYPRGILLVNKSHRGIVFVISGRKNALDRELPHARGEARRRYRTLRSEHQQSVASAHP